MTNDANQRPKILVRLLQAKSYGVERIGSHRVMFALICFYEGDQHLQLVSFSGSS